MFDAKKIRAIANEAQAEIARQKKEEEERLRKEQERLAKEAAERERLRLEELRVEQEREAARRRISKASYSLLSVVKRETTLKALKGVFETKLDLEAEVDQDFVSLELAKNYFKSDWDARDRESEIRSIIRLIGSIRDLGFSSESETGIPEINNILHYLDGKIFSYLIDKVFSSDDGIVREVDFAAAQVEWKILTSDWQDAFEVADIFFNYESHYDDGTGHETPAFRLVELLKRFYSRVNELFSFDEDNPTILHVRWDDIDWLEGDSSGGWSGHRLAWLSSYVGQFFLGQLEQYLKGLAASAKNSASIFLEPLASNPERWGANSVFRAKVDGKPIGAVVLSIDFLADVLRLMQFEVEIWKSKDGHRIALSW